MNRDHQIEFLEKADERHQAFWGKLVKDPKFVEQLSRYDSEIQPPQIKRHA